MFGILLTFFAIGMVPAFFCFGLYKNREVPYFVDSFRALFRPTSKWCPSDPVVREEYKVFKSGTLVPLRGVDNPTKVTDDDKY